VNATIAQSERVPVGEWDFPRNAWYVAATRAEVGEQPLHRWLLGKPVVLYRTEAGTVAALFDRCPHRGYPLSAGKIRGDVIECGYHGLRFDPAGQCTLIPSGGDMPRGLGVESYPVVEAWDWIWIWMGDPADADPALVPDLTPYGFGCDGWHAETGPLLECRSNYLLPFENLLDATHITFLHNGAIDAGGVAGEPLQFEMKDGRISVSRQIRNERQTPLTMRTFGFSGDTAHRSIIAEAMPPSLCGVRVVLEPVEKSAVDRQVNQLIVGITPQDRKRTLQFTAVSQTFPFVNPNREQDLRDLLMEDVVAMERIQRLNDALPADEKPEFGLRADKGAYQARRMFAAMLRREQRSVTPAQQLAEGDVA